MADPEETLSDEGVMAEEEDAAEAPKVAALTQSQRPMRKPGAEASLALSGIEDAVAMATGEAVEAGELTVTAETATTPQALAAEAKTKVRKEHIDAAKGGKLKMIIRGGVGVDNIDVKYAEENGITVMPS